MIVDFAAISRDGGMEVCGGKENGDLEERREYFGDVRPVRNASIFEFCRMFNRTGDSKPELKNYSPQNIGA